MINEMKTVIIDASTLSAIDTITLKASIELLMTTGMIFTSKTVGTEIEVTMHDAVKSLHLLNEVSSIDFDYTISK